MFFVTGGAFMKYMTTAEAAEKWGVSVRQVQRLLAANRIPDTKKYGRLQLIPSYAEKPGDPRFAKQQPLQKPLLSDFIELLTATVLPMPGDNPDAILDGMNKERLRLQYEGELAYLRGDFECTKRCYKKTEGDDAARLRAGSVTIAAAISTGDYLLYLEIEKYLKGFVKTDVNDGLSAIAELSLSTAYTGAFALNMVPEWLKNGDFSALMPQVKIDALYKRAKYLHYSGQYESMLAVVQTALELCDSKAKITFHSIYFRVLWVMACLSLGRIDEAKRRLSDALKIALPHGFITPFAESVTSFGGLLEQCLEQEYPEYYETIIKQWENTFVNWCIFHNRFTKDNITLILPLREYQIAQFVVSGVPYKHIAEHFHMSPGTLKNKMQVIYQTLFITGKNKKQELAKYIW
jgi:excisionase family DNA binding protein